jgi:hypothetical protein
VVRWRWFSSVHVSFIKNRCSLEGKLSGCSVKMGKNGES